MCKTTSSSVPVSIGKCRRQAGRHMFALLSAVAMTATSAAADAPQLNANGVADQRQSGDIATGLVSHWPMDEGTGKVAKDIVSANNGVFERGEPEWVEGRIGKGALRFSESCYLNCGKHESLNMTKAMTFAAWIKKPKDGRKSRIASKHGFDNEKKLRLADPLRRPEERQYRVADIDHRCRLARRFHHPQFLSV